MFLNKGIIMARHKDIRKELGTVSYTIGEPYLKNKKFNLVEYFQVKKQKEKESIKEEKPKIVKKMIQVDSTLKNTDMMELLTGNELKDKKKIDEQKKEEKKKEDIDEQLENFVDIKRKKEKEKAKEKEDEDLKKEKEKQEKEEQEKLKKELEELEPQNSEEKKKIIIDIENWEPDKDKQPLQL